MSFVCLSPCRSFLVQCFQEKRKLKFLAYSKSVPVPFNFSSFAMSSFYVNRTELLRRIKRYQVANHSCIVIKYEKDNRYDADGIATHDRYGVEIKKYSMVSLVREKKG